MIMDFEDLHSISRELSYLFCYKVKLYNIFNMFPQRPFFFQSLYWIYYEPKALSFIELADTEEEKFFGNRKSHGIMKVSKSKQKLFQTERKHYLLSQKYIAVKK